MRCWVTPVLLGPLLLLQLAGFVAGETDDYSAQHLPALIMLASRGGAAGQSPHPVAWVCGISAIGSYPQVLEGNQ